MKVWIAVLALCLGAASARIVVLNVGTTEHTDQWCADHMLGIGASFCVQNDGCCYDGKKGICHSCTAHSDEWCATYGGSASDPQERQVECLAYAGCTYDFDAPDGGECVSNSDWESIVDEVTCEEAFIQATEDGDSYLPQCDIDDGTWLAQQEDPTGGPNGDGMTWCVDGDGHEIPDSSFQSDLFASKLVNCEKERKKYGGMQCPNAVTLTTSNGETFLNDNDDVGNCDVRCNTDRDCNAEDWCCYNGCGYSCQSPIVPKASCAQLVLDESLKASDLSQMTHGTSVTIECNTKYSGSDEVDIECHHGHWDDYEMECLKDCEPYRVPNPERNRDYGIKGKGLHHGEKRQLSCQHGYGAVAGGPHEMFSWEETVRCVNGAWDEKSLVCSTCYDAPNNGPRAFSVPSKDNPTLLFDCTYFQSRPVACADYPSARENCRISCMSCEEMNREYKVKALKESKDGVRHPGKWMKKLIKIKKGYRPIEIDYEMEKVARVRMKDSARAARDAWAAR